MALETLKRDIHLLKNKCFLWRLYRLDGKDKTKLKRRLNRASAQQLNLLIKLLHSLMNGHIHLKKIHFQRIKQSKKHPFLRNMFEEPEDYRKLKNESPSVQRKVLMQINTYHNLLAGLFNLP